MTKKPRRKAREFWVKQTDETDRYSWDVVNAEDAALADSYWIAAGYTLMREVLPRWKRRG